MASPYSPSYIDIHVMSFEDAALYSSFADIPPTIVISIDDAGFPATPIDIGNPKILGVLKLCFADIDYPDAHGMTESDAERIVAFVKRYLPFRPEVLVHCAAGISRSAGVAAALGRWLNADERFVFDSPYRSPNALCYRRVLEAAGMPYDEGQESAKFERHRALRERWLEYGFDEALAGQVPDEGLDLDGKTVHSMEAAWKDVFGRRSFPPDTTLVRKLIAIGLSHADELEGPGEGRR